LIDKYRRNVARIFSDKQQREILDATLAYDRFMDMDVVDLVDLMAK
jgi:2-methylcitrate dehydratase